MFAAVNAELFFKYPGNYPSRYFISGIRFRSTAVGGPCAALISSFFVTAQTMRCFVAGLKRASVKHRSPCSSGLVFGLFKALIF